MSNLLPIISQYIGEILLVLSLAVLVLGVFVFRLAKSHSRSQRIWNELAEGASGRNLESLLDEHLRERLKIEQRVASAERRLQSLEKKLEASKRHLGLVRYDAFDDVGGSQSFALAVFDDRGDGAVMTSMVGRTDCRVYCKQLKSGRADRELTPEEQRAIEAAVADRMREPHSP
ncbi:MAG TPA: DUF4446 family protein [Fimbriimonadaceae bacterium]|nr:DUF4446 family protein [Fimbriimonadaceae bacterium]